MAWSPVANIRGPKGDKGDKGDPGEAPIRTVTTNSSLSPADAGGTVIVNSPSAQTLGLPRSGSGNRPATGSIIEVVQLGTGSVTLVEGTSGAGSTTIMTPVGFSTQLRAQHSRATVRVIDPGVYALGGDLAPLATYPRVFQQPVGGGPTSGTTELVVATLVVPAQPVDTIQYAPAMFHGTPDAAGADDRWLGRIRDTNTAGTERAIVFDDRVGGAASTQVRFQFPMPVGEGRSVPAGTSATYVVTVVRSSGDGTLTSILVGRGVLVLADSP